MTERPAAEVSVIIPTRAAEARRESLARAVESALCQRGTSVRLILVINGAECAPAIPREWIADPRVHILQLEKGDLPAAYRAGVRAVATGYFASLDDDDVLLPDALKVRQSALERHPNRQVVVTNGFRRIDGQDVVHVSDGDAVRADPLRAMLHRNWLLPGSWLCRTTPETRALFEDMPQHLECTYLGIRFAQLGMLWIDDPTVVYAVGSPFSVSRSREFAEAQAAALRKILTLDLPPFARRSLRPRVAAALHRAANIALRDGSVREAWRWHLAALREHDGWRYLPFARHLVRASLLRRSK